MQATRRLDQVKPGETCAIKRIWADDIKAQVIRFGLIEGKKLVCSAVIPAGPVVIRINQQEIAMGRNLARNIEIEELFNA